jgi:hypothetical protein
MLPETSFTKRGTVRMGNNPKRAPLNKWAQAHDCKNLFNVDGGMFVSQVIKIYIGGGGGWGGGGGGGVGGMGGGGWGGGGGG